MQSVKIGLLPFYLELYDRMLPDCRRPLEKYCHNVAEALRHKGLNVAAAPVCRVAAEFRRAVKDFEAAGVDALVTLHLAVRCPWNRRRYWRRQVCRSSCWTPPPIMISGRHRRRRPSCATTASMACRTCAICWLRRGKRFAEAGHWRKSGVWTGGWCARAPSPEACAGRASGRSGLARACAGRRCWKEQRLPA